MPLVHSYTPGEKSSQAIGSLALAGGGPHRNPARPAAERVGEVGNID
jgi:hypothetical protein